MQTQDEKPMGPTNEHGSCIDDYKLLSLLGKGSHGTVYEACCSKCGDKHALKMVEKDHLKKLNLTMLLVNEMKLHQKLHHPRIVRLVQCFADEKRVYLVTELCKNGELNALVKREKQLPISRVKRMFRQIVEGVQYLHQNRIIHRDLKLANIMLTEEGDIKIGDFGLAVQLKDCREERETMCGTPNYMSPEVLENLPYNFEADIWSLGCILYALLVGRPPFDSPNVQGTMVKVKKGKYDLPAGVGPEAQDLIQRLLRKDRQERITMAQIMNHTFLQEEVPANAVPESAPEPEAEEEDAKESQPEPEEKEEEEEEEEEEKQKPQPAHDDQRRRATREDEEENLGERANREEAPRKKGHSSKSSKETGAPARNLNTERLRPITHTTQHGSIRIDDKGNVELEVASRAKVMRISPNGQRIAVFSRIIENCANEFNLSTLPQKYYAMYHYAYEFVNVLRSKTPKVVIRTAAGHKFCLMENEPSHNCEFSRKDGARVFYQVSGTLMEIWTAEGEHFQINPYKEYSALREEDKRLVGEFFELLKRCEETERRGEMEGSKFPVVVAEQKGRGAAM